MSFSFTAPRFTEAQQEAERNSLSMEERARIEAELYGNEREQEETDELLKYSLQAFQLCLDAITDKAEYEEALEKCPKLVETESEPIRFLRAENFDPKKSAQRLVAYWQMRKQIFGPEKAFLPMAIDGALWESDLATLRAIPEYYWVLPGPDQHGRTVFLKDKTRVDWEMYDRNSITRLFWYQMHIALQREETQKKGVVVVAAVKAAHIGQFDRRQQVLTFSSLNKALPIRIMAWHMCHPPSFFNVVWPVLAFCMGTSIRQRVYIRKGNENVVLSELSSYGIPTSILPKRSLGGDCELNVETWIAERREKEAEIMASYTNQD